MGQRTGRRVLLIGLLLLALAITVRARLLTWHLTEGEALVTLWPHWTIAALLLVAASLLLRRDA
jgi:hypothetical protein